MKFTKKTIASVFLSASVTGMSAQIPMSLDAFSVSTGTTRERAVSSQLVRPDLARIPIMKSVEAALPSAKSATRRVPGTAGSPEIYGFLYTSYAGSGLDNGFYKVYLDKEATFMWADYYVSDWNMSHVAGWLRDGKLCGISGFLYMGAYMVYCYQETNLESGEILKYEPIEWGSDNQLPVFISAAYCDYDDMVYGYGFNEDGSGYSFTKAPSTDISKAESILHLSDNSTLCPALCYDTQAGLFYGINMEGNFVTVDTQGNQEILFAVNIPGWTPNYATGLVYSPADQAFIYNAYLSQTGGASLYKIEPATKSVTLLHNSVGGQLFRYLVCADENAPAGAPAIATAAGHQFAGSSLDGTVSYTLPTITNNGSTLSGNLDWELLIDGNPAGNGSAAPGAEVNVEVKGLKNGANVFAFHTSKDGLRSAPAIFNDWIGSDYPEAPAEVTLTETTATWTPVTTSVHGGYVDYDAMEYIVRLNGKEVARTKETSAAVTIATDKPYATYSVEVCATYDGKISQPGKSNYITLGEPIVPPVHYRCTEEQLALMTLINVDGRKDENGNDISWFYTEEMGFPSFASGYNGDDWLILPPLDLQQTEKAYRYEMEIGLVSDVDTSGTWELWLGKTPTAEGMTRMLVPPTHCEHMLGDIIEEYFAVSEPGTYYIGLHVKTGKVSFHLSDIDVSLSTKSAYSPASVTSLTAVPGDNGALKANVGFIMPEIYASGAAIPADKVITATVNAVSVEPGYPDRDEVVSEVKVTGRPGDIISGVEIETAQNYNEIRVECSVDGETGRYVSALIFTGVVRPYLVNNLTGTVDEDNMGMLLRWDPPTEGEEEGPIGDSFYYAVYYYNAGWEYGDEAGWDVNEYNYRLNPGAPQGISTIGIMALNGAGLSYHVTGVSAVLGTPYILPMDEEFNMYSETYSGMTSYVPAGNDPSSYTYWLLTDPSEVSPIFACPTGVAFIGYMATEDTAKNQKVGITLPKFSTMDMSDVKVTIDYYSGSHSAPLTLYAQTFDMEKPELIGTLPTLGGWGSSTITLPSKFEGYKWVQILMEGDLADSQTFALFSGYHISGTTTGVEDIAAETVGSVSVEGNSIVVRGYEGEDLIICDAAGRTVASDTSVASHAAYAVAPGVYIVRIGAAATKIIVGK